MGSDKGVVRIFNITNIKKPILIRILKLYNNKTISNVQFNPN